MLETGIIREVHLVHVVEVAVAPPRGRLDAIADHVMTLALALKPSVQGLAWAHVRTGSLAPSIVRLANDVGASLVIVGDRDDGGAIDTSRFDPFSVFQAGARLTLDSRPHVAAAPCAACASIRMLRRVKRVAFCPAHNRQECASVRITGRPVVAFLPD
ncbi:MAG: hypothetical protein M3Y87_30110 [Myxococcota bacterium]|nr:hypothetical protein [Myxococcota bacterium]